MKYDKTKIPKTIEELYEYGWVNLIRLKVSRWSLNDVTNSVEDIVQDVLTQMWKVDYLSKYDPDSRPFEVYLLIFVRNVMTKKFKKENASKNGQKIIFAKSLEISMPEDASDIDGSVEYLDKLEDEKSSFEGYSVLLESLRQDLEQFKANSSVLHNGVELQRDPKTVLNLMLEGYSVKDIATVFQTSDQFIYLLLKKIRSCPTVADYKFNR